MALIVEYHVVADMYPVAQSTSIKAGMILTLDSDGYVVPAPTSTDPGKKAIGIAGDTTTGSEGSTTASSDEVVVGATSEPTSTAKTRWTSNRVSDFYDESKASGKVTVYSGGGKFWISDDLFDSASDVTPGTPLGVGDTAGYWEHSAITDDDIVAIAVGDASSYPSGVPGTDTTDGNIALENAGDDTWVPVVLRV